MKNVFGRNDPANRARLSGKYFLACTKLFVCLTFRVVGLLNVPRPRNTKGKASVSRVGKIFRTLTNINTRCCLLYLQQAKAVGNGGFNEIMEATLDYNEKPTASSKM